MNNAILEDITKEVGELCQKGKYQEAYIKCELVYIQFSNYIEWCDDNKWYKNGVWKGKQRGTVISKNSISFLEIERNDTEEEPAEINGVRIRKRKEKKNVFPEIDVTIRIPLLLMDWFSVAAFHTGNPCRSFYISHKLIQTNFCNNSFELNRVKNNLSYCMDAIKDRLLFYPDDIISDFEKLKFENRIKIYIQYSKDLNLTLNSILNGIKDLKMLELPFIVLTKSYKVDNFDQYSNFIKFVHIDDLEYEYPHLYIQKNTSFFCRRNYIKMPLDILIENAKMESVLFNQISSGISPKDLREDQITEYKTTLKGRKFLIKEQIYQTKGSGVYRRKFIPAETTVSATFISNHYTNF